MTNTEKLALTAFRRSVPARLLSPVLARLETEAQARYEQQPASDVNRGMLLGIRSIRELLFVTPL
jgi:hypothetical protein